MSQNLTRPSIEQKIIDILTARKYRITEMRLMIVKIIAGTRHFTVKYVINEVNRFLKNKKVNVMSVYNIINLLIKEHLLFANVFNGKDIIYELIIDNTIHAVCENCFRIMHIDVADKTALYNYAISDKIRALNWDPAIHFTLEVHSICPDCKAKP